MPPKTKQKTGLTCYFLWTPFLLFASASLALFSSVFQTLKSYCRRIICFVAVAAGVVAVVIAVSLLPMDIHRTSTRGQVLHSALHPHVIKVMETFASEDALLEYFHQCNSGYLEGVSDFRAAVSPTTQAYTPLEASLRPALSAR